MNYLAEIRHFYDWLETESLPSNAIVLWHALMFTANRCGWREEFSVPFSVLENRTKLDKSTICRMRRILVERGVISVCGQRGRRSAVYRLNPFERHPAEHDTTVSATQIHPMTGKALQSATPTATVSIQDRIIPEKEKTSKKEKAPRRRKERKGCAEKREPMRQNLSQFLASLDEAWRVPMSIWLEYKRSRREGYRSEMGARKCLALLRDLSGDDPAVAAAVIDRSIANNWAGLFPLRPGDTSAPSRIRNSGDVLHPATEEHARRLLEKFDRSTK